MDSTTRELAGRIRRRPATPPLRLRQGVVAVVNTAPASVDVKIGGAAPATPKVRYLAGYTPTVGDTVWLLEAGQLRIVVDKLAV